ncbi:MAG: PAS domain-containing protein [Fischerella sp.]|nr:PAS domain-containing protein [Fischerella sp.]
MPDIKHCLKQLVDDQLARQGQANGQAKLTMVAGEEQAMVLQLAKGGIQAWNPTAERILGLTAEQLVGRNWLELPCKAICEDGSPVSDATHPAMVALHTGKACLNIVMGLYQPHDQLVWLLVNSQPLFLPGENIPYAVVTTLVEIAALANLALAAETHTSAFEWGEAALVGDITKQRRIEIALQQSQERFELAAAAANCLIYDWDIQNDTLERTKSLSQLLGYTLAEIEPTSKWWRSRIHPDDLEKARDNFTASLAKGNRFCNHYRVRHKDGHYIWVEDRGLAVRDENNRLLRIVGITTDISERKQVEANLRESEERIRLATAAAELGMWFWNLTTDKLVWTPKCKQLFGLPANMEVNYELFLNCLHPDDRDRIHAAVTSTLEEKVDYDIEYRAIWPDGSVHWIAAKGRCLYDAMGKPVRMMGTAQDITQRKHTEEALRQSEERYRTLAEAIPEMVWTTNAQGWADYVNQRWIDYTGLSLEETTGYGWQKVLHPEDIKVMLRRWQKSVRTRTLYECEQRFRRAADGTYRWHLVRAYPLKDNQGHIVKWFGTCTDIHDQKQIEAERAQLLEREKAARAEAEAANRIKDQFLAILSHELRSPLNPILGWTKLLKNRKLDPAATGRALDTIERNAKLQIQLIDDLLDVSRILRGKLSINYAAVDLVSVIDAALETVRLAAQTKNIQLEYVPLPPSAESGKGGECESETTSPYIVWGDFNRLQQIVSNLLSNAVKFTPDGGKVEVRLSKGPGTGKEFSQSPIPYAQITVTDTGLGIAPEFLPHVFEYFRQADSSTTRKFGGLGLGLAIVHHLVELHGGIVTADSPGEGQGATFTVKLPLRKNTQEKGKRGREGENTPSSLAGMRILVVDDNTDTRDFLCYLLKEYGATVTVAASASEALASFKQLQHDLLISDVGMPEIDGYSLIAQIRAMSPERGGNIPAIALTAYAGNGDRSRILAAGFQIHIAKPLDADQLLMAIADLSGKRG